MKRPRAVASRGGLFVHTVVWLALIAGVTWFFYVYLQGEHNPNRAPRVTASGEIVLKRNREGHFVAGGAINGRHVTFLVDTGATQIALPRGIAEKLQLARGLPVELMTAAGPSQGYMTKLATVDLASLRITDLSATIVDKLDDDTVFLGMNFLRHVEMSQRGDELVLRPVAPSR